MIYLSGEIPCFKNVWFVVLKLYITSTQSFTKNIHNKIQIKENDNFDLRWAVHHAQASQITIWDGKQQHEQNGEVIFMKKYWRMFPWLCIAKCKQRKKYNSQKAEEWQKHTIFTRLKEREERYWLGEKLSNKTFLG